MAEYDFPVVMVVETQPQIIARHRAVCSMLLDGLSCYTVLIPCPALTLDVGEYRELQSSGASASGHLFCDESRCATKRRLWDMNSWQLEPFVSTDDRPIDHIRVQWCVYKYVYVI